MGSSREALRAGQTPKSNRHRWKLLSPEMTAQVWNRSGSAGTRSMISLLMPHRDHDPGNAAEKRKRHRFERNCRTMSRRRAPKSFTYADFFRSFRHAHQHDIHHTDTANQKAETGNGNSNQSHHGSDAVKLFDKLVGGFDVKLLGRQTLHYDGGEESLADCCNASVVCPDRALITSSM